MVGDGREGDGRLAKTGRRRQPLRRRRQQRTTATAKDYSDSKGLQRRADGAGQAAAVA